MKQIVKVSDKFPYPGSRFIKLGPQSGEAFKNYLHKHLTNCYGSDFSKNINNEFIVDLDGTIGYGSSFLEEGFGGLIRMGVPASIVLKIKVVSNEEPELVGDIKEYIEDEIKKQESK